MLDVGDRVPDFTAQTTDGKTVRMADLRGKYVVLYFFPKAFTKG
jgi:peroxiredoxin Q/BCP